MKLIIKFLVFYICFVISNAQANKSFFNEAKNLYEKKKYEDSKFLFQRNIVFNPKNAESYLYLAKIYKTEKNEREEEKNLDTTLLLEPNNEEALYMLINIKLKKSNFSEVKDLTKNFEIICSNLCNKIIDIKKNLKDIEAKDES